MQINKTNTKKRGGGIEAQRIKERIQNFNYKTSTAYLKLIERFGPKLILPEYVLIAEQVCERISNDYPIKLDRTAKRDTKVLMKWFQENWEVAEPIIDRMYFYDCTINLNDFFKC